MLFYTSILTIILSIILVYFNSKVNKSVWYLAVFFVAFAIYGISHHFTLYSDSPFWLSVFYNHFSPIYFLPGPVLYFYTKESLTDKKALTSWKDYLHFIPAFINLIAIVPYIISPFSEKELIAKQILNDLELLKTVKMNWLYPPIVGFIARPISLLIYGLIIFVKLMRHNPKKEILVRIPKAQYFFIKKWILSLSIAGCVVAILFLSLTLKFVEQKISTVLVNSLPLHFAIGIIFCMLPITLFLFPKILYGMPISAEAEKPLLTHIPKKNKASISNNEDPFLALSAAIMAYLEQEKPFVNSTFSMSRIALIFDVPQHHVAYCFNNVLKTKFTDLRTEFRVNHAKELLDKGLTSTLSIDGIGFKAGFSSRSSFFATFKAETGMTPTQYLQQKAKP